MTEEEAAATFDGKRFFYKKGEPLAVSLYRNGIKNLGLSPRYLRPRGFTHLEWWIPERLQSENDPFMNPYNAISGGDLSVTSPTVNAPYRLVMKVLGSHVDVGFLHTAPVKKRLIWRLVSRFLEGDLPHPRAKRTNMDSVTHSVLEADVVVVGSGISGLSFALKLRELGGKVIVLEGDRFLGGHAAYDESEMYGGGGTVRQYVRSLVESASQEGVLLLTGTVFDGFFEDGVLALRLGGVGADAPVLLKARIYVFAGGLRDLPSIFENNDLPGHMVASSALKIVNLYGVNLGRKGVVIGSGEYAARTAVQLKKKGVDITLVTKQGSLDGVREKYLDELKGQVRIARGASQIRARGKAVVQRLAVDDDEIDVDVVVSAESWTPTLEILGQAGVPMGYSRWTRCLLPMHGWFGETINSSVYVVGRCSGILDEDASRFFAEAAAYYVAHKLKLKVDREDVENELNKARSVLKEMYPENYDFYGKLVDDFEKRSLLNEVEDVANYAGDLSRAFLCFCEDVSAEDVRQAVQVHGFNDVELVKRYTGLGTGKCQGKRCLMHTARMISQLTGRSPCEVGITRQRPMVVSTSIESLAGLES